MSGIERENLSLDPSSNPYGFIEMGADPIVFNDPETHMITEWSTSEARGVTERTDKTPSGRYQRRVQKTIRPRFHNDYLLEAIRDYDRLFVHDWGTNTVTDRSILFETKAHKEVDGSIIVDERVLFGAHRGNTRCEMIYSPEATETGLNPISELSLKLFAEGTIEFGQFQGDINTAVFYFMNRAHVNTFMDIGINIGKSEHEADIKANLAEINQLVGLIGPDVIWGDQGKDIAIAASKMNVGDDVYFDKVVNFVRGYLGYYAEGILSPDLSEELSISVGSTVASNVLRDIRDLNQPESRKRLEEETFERLAWMIAEHYHDNATSIQHEVTFSNLTSEDAIGIKVSNMNEVDKVLNEGEITLGQEFRHERNIYSLRKVDNGQLVLTVKDIFQRDKVMLVNVPQAVNLKAIKGAATAPHNTLWGLALEMFFKPSINNEF